MSFNVILCFFTLVLLLFWYMILFYFFISHFNIFHNPIHVYNKIWSFITPSISALYFFSMTWTYPYLSSYISSHYCMYENFIHARMCLDPFSVQYSPRKSLAHILLPAVLSFLLFLLFAFSFLNKLLTPVAVDLMNVGPTSNYILFF